MAAKGLKDLSAVWHMKLYTRRSKTHSFDSLRQKRHGSRKICRHTPSFLVSELILGHASRKMALSSLNAVSEVRLGTLCSPPAP